MVPFRKARTGGDISVINSAMASGDHSKNRHGGSSQILSSSGILGTESLEGASKPVFANSHNTADIDEGRAERSFSFENCCARCAEKKSIEIKLQISEERDAMALSALVPGPSSQ